MDHVARADGVQQLLRIGRVSWIFHRVEVIEIAKEFVEAVYGGEKLVLVAKMVLAELAGGVAHSLKGLGNCHRLRGNTCGRSSLADRGHSGADWQFAGDEVGAARRAARPGVVIGKQHAFRTTRV